MRKVLMIAFVVIVCVVSIGAERREYQIRIDPAGLQLMHTTAYHTGTTTANGSAVHIGGCACNPHLGDVAIIYTTDGEYLGMYECNDTGSTEGLKAGTVIDVYYPTLAECTRWMIKTRGKVRVMWVKGNG